MECATRSKVIDGLKHHADGLCKGQNGWCPYYSENDYCCKNMLNDAIELLIPHLIPFSVIRRSMAVWIEYRDKPETVLAIGGSDAGYCKCFISEQDQSIALNNDEYNKRWRAWTQEPTNGQREAVKWNG